jgi:tRNA threonylcarbamoyladenosine biosynthesis protein TsaB
MKRRYTLAIEGATYEGSAALLSESDGQEQGLVVAERTLQSEDGTRSRTGRGERLMPAIAECLDQAGVKRNEIARIVCGAGPGSFTSLRVAGSIAKGLASGLGIELYAVSSLLLTLTGARPPLPSGEYLSVLDAMRGEFFAAHIIVGQEGVGSEISAPTLLTAETLEGLRLRERALKVIGPGQQIDSRPHARGVAGILRAITAIGPVNLASWEPDYGRLAEAQVRWEAIHGRPLAT